jgi:hypothetical protein
MSLPAASAIKAWINARPGLTGKGRPLSRGAYLMGDPIRSPAHGAYALLFREPGSGAGGTASPVAEDNEPSLARITAHVYAGTIQAAEAAADALSNAWQDLNGCPEPCGTSGVTVMVAADFSEPGYTPMPASGGELHMFTTSATFMLRPS